MRKPPKSETCPTSGFFLAGDFTRLLKRELKRFLIVELWWTKNYRYCRSCHCNILSFMSYWNSHLFFIHHSFLSRQSLKETRVGFCNLTFSFTFPKSLMSSLICLPTFSRWLYRWKLQEVELKNIDSAASLYHGSFIIQDYDPKRMNSLKHLNVNQAALLFDSWLCSWYLEGKWDWIQISN